MTELLKDYRVAIFAFLLLGSIVAIHPGYSNGSFTTNLRYGLDLEGGSWLQLQLEGAMVQVDVDESKILQSELERILEDPSLEMERLSPFTYRLLARVNLSQEELDQGIYTEGYGQAIIEGEDDGRYNITFRTSRDTIIQAYLANKLKTEVKVIPSETGAYFEIRGEVTEDRIKELLEPFQGEVVDFLPRVSAETLQDTKDILSVKLNRLGMRDIPIRSVGEDFILIDMAGVDLATARNMAARQGRFEIRINVSENESVHVLYGDQIRDVGVPTVDRKSKMWGVPFSLTPQGARAFREAALKYGAVDDPLSHKISMYLDEQVVFSAPLSQDLADDLREREILQLRAETGREEDGGKERAKELQIHLRTGALPVNVKVIGSGQVSASLGERFKSQLLAAGILALLAVALVVYRRYRRREIILPMLSTSFGEVIIMLGFAALVKWQLDLPSLTGIIAVIGTGVDHLIIITDEVLLEGELPHARTYLARVGRAFSIILAAAATLGVAMFFLAFMGFGYLKGFAIFTMIGIFVGVIIARPAYARIIRATLKVG